ncbi:hypothetical protein Golob_026552, partial [Gossypium lobatum]|nr:hypothetical protein [Gossypium lobatum]
AINEGLTLAWKKGFHKVVIKRDNALLIDIIGNGYVVDNNLPELNLIYKFCHVLLEQNRLADCMAKVVLSELNRLLAFENPPDHVRSLFEEDAHRAIVNIDSHQ